MSEPSAHYDVLIVGAGPAGLAAARAAASHGARVGLIDAQARPGGQVWRHDIASPPPRAARRMIESLPEGTEFLAQTQVLMAAERSLLVEAPQGARQLFYRSLILATGARELLLPFPGWTLLGVTGAGGAQALLKQGWPMAGRRVLVAGSGPLLLAAAATLRAHGAQVLGILEQAPRSAVLGFAAGLWRWPGKAVQALALRARLLGIPYRTGAMVRAALGEEQLHAVEIESARGVERIDCDHLAVGYGLVPNVELAQLLGCRLQANGAHVQVAVDEALRTSVEHIYAAGEVCGIGGRDTALIEGEMAGLHAVGATAAAAALQSRRQHARDFSEHLSRSFVLGARVHALATPETLVCRCEDVPLSALRGFASLRAAKLATRCGMGACQGRICGAALAELGLFASNDKYDDDGRDGGRRPPLFPLRLATLAESFPIDSQGAHS
ncbi:FAD-dependent oxidoreductase [Pseudoxanthomonas sp. UTMC 1351]|uniref:FAD-dependent oxidoreductase n=1 Tax=Pseudoxanthomonas sp. UTMC 1351 TaxID=2695853 RepID=UPI0034CE9781